MDFKFCSHWLCAKKQSILLQHMHEKDYFILTNKCATKRLHENEAKGAAIPFGPLSLVFVLKLIPAFIGQNNKCFIMHVLKNDVLLFCA
jgi:hypothetical protein